MSRVENIQDFVHPITVNRDVNGALMPWSDGYRDIFSAEVIAASGRTFGAICAKFGKAAVAAAMRQGKIMIACNAWRATDDEPWVHGVEFDVSRCSDSTPMTANGIAMG